MQRFIFFTVLFLQSAGQVSTAAPHNNQPTTGAQSSKLLKQERTHKCHLCPSAFVQYSSLRLHVASYHKQKLQSNELGNGGGGHSGGQGNGTDNDKKHKCSVCGLAFIEFCNLRIHMSVCHNQKVSKAFDACSVNKSSNNDVSHKPFAKRNVSVASKETSTLEKRFQCDVCPEAFSHNSDLIKHKQLHMGDKPFQCDVCLMIFSDPSSLTRHKRIHSCDKPYQCDVCHKAFSDSSNLTKHKKLHTGDKPFQCDVCPKAFSQSGNLTRHKLTHTGDKP
jgi:KRAB domain-containing zinc finger protein